VDNNSARDSLVEQLAESFVERFRRGERPAISEYVERYPQLADQIQEVFPALVAMEQVHRDIQAEAPPPTAPCAVPVLTTLGDFHILREVGRGGMGIVYEAEQVSLGRRVALKVLAGSMLADAKHRKRFEREARSAARLHHTNIVPVFGVGEQDGVYYYVMQYINGLGLDEVLNELKQLRSQSTTPGIDQATQPHAAAPRSRQPDVSAVNVAEALLSGNFAPTVLFDRSHRSGEADAPAPALSATAVGQLSNTAPHPRSFALPGQSEQSGKSHNRTVYWQGIARIGAQAADALQYAHEQGVIHRDIKPANLLLDTRGSVWVTDFGLAKANDQQDLTHTGDVLGTLRYMAPEAFENKTDVRSDVYALGLTLYELLSLMPAFGETDRHKLIKQVTTGTPPRLRTLDPHIPRDLEIIVHKAIDREPEQRYQSAGELAADLQRYLGDEPIRARRISPVRRLARWCRRNPAVASLTTTIALLLTIASAVSLVAAMRFEKLAKHNANLVVQADQDKALALVAQQEAEAAQRQAETAAATEKRLREEAERQKDRANTNFARARRAVDAYLSKVTDEELLAVPGLQPLREDLLAEALKFYSEFIQEQSDDPALQVELAAAQHRLAIIQRELGNAEASQKANAEALRLLEVIRNKPTAGREVLALLANGYYMAKRYDDAIQVCQDVLKTDPENWEVQSTLAETHNALAINKADSKDLAAALESHQRAFEIRQKLVQQHPHSAEYNAELASTLNNIGVLLSQQKKATEKLAMFQLSLPYNQTACTLAPHSVLWGRWMAITLQNIASTQHELGRPQEALQALQQQTAALRRLVVENPAVSSLRSDYYKALLRLGEQQRQMGLTVEANRSVRDAREVLTQIRRETPAEKFELATVYAALAQPPDPTRELVPDDAEAADERQRNADLAMATLQQAVAAGWSDPAALKNYTVLDVLRSRDEFQQLAATVSALSEASKLLAAEAKTDQAKVANQQRAVELLQRIPDGSAQLISHRKTLAATQHSIGVVQTNLRQFDAAEKSLAQAVASRAELRDSNPGDFELTLDWLASQVAQGQLDWEQEAYPQAHRRWQECVGELGKLRESVSTNRNLQAKVVALERMIFERYGHLGLFPLVRDFLVRNAAQHLISAADSGGLVTDGEFSIATLLSEDREVAREYFRQLGDSVAATSDRLLIHDAIHFVRGACLVGDDVPIDEAIAQKVRKRFEEKPQEAWIAVAVALMEFRAQRHAQADDVLRRFRSSSWDQKDYLDVAVSWKAGERERALARWKMLEASQGQRIGELLRRSPAKNTNGVFKEHWWQFVFTQLMRRLAAETITEGQRVPDDPWLHLTQARGYHLIGEHANAEQELAAATAAVPHDPEVWIAIAGLHAQWNQPAAAEASWAKAVESAGDDPRLLIRRGRWHAQNGEQEKADADYAQAASLTPHELNRFLEGGWWVAGPYPRFLDQHSPPQLGADPAIPVHTVDSQGLSDEPVPWTEVSTGDFGRIELANYAGGKGNVSLFAMTHVYSPQETTATLCFSSNGDARIWVNGELVHLFSPPTTAARYWSRDPERIPCTLRAGRNTILIKGFADSALTLRLGDHPYDRGLELARYGEWREAADLVEQGLRRSSEVYAAEYPFRNLASIRLAAGDVEAVRKLYAKLASYHRNTTDEHWKLAIANIGSLAPGIVDDPEELVARAEIARTHKEFWWRMILPWAYLRACRWQEAADFIANDREAETYPAESAARLAVAYHHLGHETKARAALAESQRHFGDMMLWNPRWPVNFVYLGLLLPRDASLAVTGSATEAEQKFEEYFRQRRAVRDRFSRETFDFDAAVHVYPDKPHLYVARGKRLAALGRFDEARVDFNQAVAFRSDDPDLLAARAQFLADCGNPAEAAADFDAALKQLEIQRPPRWDSGHAIDLAVAARDPVYEALSALRPTDGHLLHMRILIQFRRGERESLAAECRQLERLGFHAYLAGIHLLRGDVAEFDRLRGSLNDDAYHRTLRLGQAPTDEAMTRQLLSAADELGHEERQDRWKRRWIGLAQLRAGRLAEAKATLLGCVDREVGWESNSVIWAMLAIVCHELDETEEARRWLRKAETWLHGFARLSPTELADVKIPSAIYLNDWFLSCLFYREAKVLIDGPDAAEAELAVVARGAAAAPQVSAEQRRETFLTKTVEAAAGDPLPLIQRGRWYAERGKHEQADADYAKAAALTPHELNKFLEAGWWVVGPYPPNLDEFCPPELDPDPSQPMRVIFPQTGLSDQPVKWRPLPSDSLGAVDLAGMPAGSTYAMTYVYSPAERSVLLRIEQARQLRLWCNGEPVYNSNVALGRFLNGARVPLVLRAGRNVLLAKAPTGTTFNIRVGDTPLDRALGFAERRLWLEAAELSATTDVQQPLQSDVAAICEFAKLTLLNRNDQLYCGQCVEAFQQFRHGDRWDKFHVGHLVSFAPNPVLEAHYDEVVELALSFPDPAASPPNVGHQGRALLSAAWAALQTDHLPATERYLSELPALRWVQDLALPIRAILAKKTGNDGEALEWLQKSLANTTPALSATEIGYWPHTVTKLLQVRAAEQIVTGSTTQMDALIHAAHEQARALSDSADPLTAAFDHRVLTSKAVGGQLSPQGLAEVARGRRLAELGRFSEAEADLNRAVELAPRDPDVLAARAVFLAQRGDTDRAATDILAAFDSFSAEATDKGERQRILLEVVRHDDVYARVRELRKDYPALQMIRMIHHVRQGDAQAALAEAERLGDSNRGFDSLAVIRLCGSAAEFERRRGGASPRPQPHWYCWSLGLAPTNEAMTIDLLAAVETVQESPRLVGLAQLRAGRLQDAVATFKRIKSGSPTWHGHANVWPLLAIAEHRLGHREQARHWLNTTEFVLQMHEEAAARGRIDTINPTQALHAQDWLLAVVFYVEAKALLDGTQFADEARTLLARWAETAKRQAQANGVPRDELRAGPASTSEKPSP
jgi:serine/threonine protein kinase/tetratricopeptide (TPR) repeat protein/Tfp pilus assembly protein PilF